MTAWGVAVTVVAVLVIETIAGIGMGLYMQHFGANRQSTELDPDHPWSYKAAEPVQLYDQDDEPPVRNDSPPDPPPERKPMIGLE